MPNRTDKIPMESGESRTGSRRHQGMWFIESAVGFASMLAMNDSAGVTWYLWFDTTGDVRIANAVPTDFQANGAVVGGQS